MNFNLVLEDQGLGGILGQRLFFEPSKLAFGFLVSRFVPFAFHGVLGAMHRKMFLMQEATNLIAAEANSCNLGQVRRQARGRPRGKAVAQSLGVGLHRLGQKFPERRRRFAGTPRRFAGLQGGNATLPIQSPNALDSFGTATEELGDSRNGVTTVGQQDNGTIAKDVGRRRRVAEFVEFVEASIGKSNSIPHDNLLTAEGQLTV